MKKYKYSHNGMMDPPTVIDENNYLIATVYSSDYDARLFAKAHEIKTALMECAALFEGMGQPFQAKRIDGLLKEINP